MQLCPAIGQVVPVTLTSESCMEIVRPQSLHEAIELGQSGGFDAKYISGGTAVVLMLQQGLVAPSLLIDLRYLEDVDGLRTITTTDDEASIRVGAGVTLTEVAYSPVVREKLPELAQAASVVGNIRVRNIATLAGNAAEADYSSDPPSVLVNRDACAVIMGPDGERRELIDDLVTDFYSTTLQEGEIITLIEIPVVQGEAARYDKFRSRSSEDRPCIAVASRLGLDEGRIRSLSVTVGAATASPVRFSDVADAVIGREMGPKVAAEVAEAYAQRIDPISDGRGSDWYRRQVIEVHVRRALSRLSGEVAT